MEFLKLLRKDARKSMRDGIKWDVRFILVGSAVAVIGFGISMLGQAIGGTLGTYLIVGGFAVIFIGLVAAGGLIGF